MDPDFNPKFLKNISSIYGFRITGNLAPEITSEQVVDRFLCFLKDKNMYKQFVEMYGPSVSLLTE